MGCPQPAASFVATASLVGLVVVGNLQRDLLLPASMVHALLAWALKKCLAAGLLKRMHGLSRCRGARCGCPLVWSSYTGLGCGSLPHKGKLPISQTRLRTRDCRIAEKWLHNSCGRLCMKTHGLPTRIAISGISTPVYRPTLPRPLGGSKIRSTFRLYRSTRVQNWMVGSTYWILPGV